MSSSCKNKNCGTCTDISIGVPNTFSNNPSECPTNSEPCTEVFETDCVCWTGPNICELNIKKGDRLTSILDKAILAIKTNSCSIETLSTLFENLEAEVQNVVKVNTELQNLINENVSKITYFYEGDSSSLLSSGHLYPNTDTLLEPGFEFTNTSTGTKKFIVNSNFTFITSNNNIPLTGNNYGKIFKTDTTNNKVLLTSKRHVFSININDGSNNPSGANSLHFDYTLMYVVTLAQNEKVSLEFLGDGRVYKAQLLITEIDN